MNRQTGDTGAAASGQAATAADTLLPVARVNRPHGIRGALRILPYSGDPATLEIYDAFLVQQDEGGFLPFCSLGCRSHGRFAVLALEGIVNREQAQTLAGRELYVAKEMMPPLDRDEFYWHDLIGRTVETGDGLVLGVVRGLMAIGGGPDLLQVLDGDREILIPAAAAFLLEKREGRIVVSLPPGFLEING